MKIIYAKKSSGIDEQGSFQNPEYYLKPESNAQLVLIYGDYPKIKADYEELGVDVEVRELLEVKPLTAGIKVGTTPELQAAIDQAKAECEKVVAEQLNKEREAVKKLDLENQQLKDQVLIAEKALVAADAEIKALKAASKKPTAAELKAAKAAEEAAKAEQPKE